MTAAYQLRNIEQCYNGTVVLALDDYMIESQRVTALVGPNGSGKSTLMDMLALIQRPQRGQLEFFNREAAGSTRELQQQIGYVQQKPYLFNISVEQNIGLGLKLRGVAKPERERRVDAVIEEFNLAKVRNRRGHDLSGGEIQKVALARTLILKPRVLILDEPFSHVDKQFRVELEQTLRTIREHGEQTVIFSTHDQLQAETLADHVFNLDEASSQPGHIVNMFHGHVIGNDSVFDTGKIRIDIPKAFKGGTSLVIDSSRIELSRYECQPESDNHFLGRIKSLAEESGQIHVTFDTGEIFHATLSPQAWQALGTNIGDSLWIGFNRDAVKIL